MLNRDTYSLSGGHGYITLISAFLASFLLTLSTQFPCIAPYRDSGEMATTINLLGIIHPPGYPLYALLGKIFILLVPFANIAYRLNLLSGIFTALSAVFIIQIFWILAGLHPAAETKEPVHDKIDPRGIPPKHGGWFAATMLSLLVPASFVTSYLQWYLSLVSEMYTFNIFLATLLIYMVVRILFSTGLNIPLLFLVAFISGLSTGNRMEILLLVPGILLFLLLYLKSHSKTGTFDYYSLVIKLSLFFLLGLSVYLYLPLRSSQNPLFDWNHPATFEKLFSTLTRKTHGGTLDLLSASYGRGNNFFSGIVFYLKHLFTGFGYIGILTGISGLYFSFKLRNFNANAVTGTGWFNLPRGRNLIFFLLTGFILTGPVFIYLGNMPPNPHALAILEAHFLLPNLIFFMFMLPGFLVIPGIRNSTILSLFFLPALITGINLYNNFDGLNKRNNFFAYDYAKNVLRSASRNSIVVAKEDVQLFSLWAVQNTDNYRKDVVVFAEGLSASPWYHNMLRRRYNDVFFCSLKDAESLKQFVNSNSPKRDVYYTVETELPASEACPNFPLGLVSRYGKFFFPQQAQTLLDNIYAYRGKYDYTAHREFFTPDLIEDYAKARHKLGYYYMSKNDMPDARKNFIITLLYKEHFTLATYHLAYTYLAENDYPGAEKFYLDSVREHEYTLQLAKQYNALPDVTAGIKRDFAEVCLHLGVIEEKLGNPDMALQYYSKALEQNPDFARAYFNRSVIYWKRNAWDRVIYELTKAVAADPNFNEAKFYLEQARKKISK